MTFSITTYSIMKLCITIQNATLSIITLVTVILWVVYAVPFMLSVANKSNMLSVVMLNVILINVMVMRSVLKLNVIRKNVKFPPAELVAPPRHSA